jgi:DeoR/GlpR family transcriptional regulator of sugar metabolism
MSKKTQARQNEIYSLLLSDFEVKVIDLAKKYNVSMETIRSDLTTMENQGLIVKEHGKAKLKESYAEVSVEYKMTENKKDKEIIAKKALEYIQDGSTIFLDPGSTTLTLAKYLPLKKDLLVVTNSLKIAQVVVETKHDLIFLGGKMLKKAKACSGSFTNNHLDSIHIDACFMGCDGFMNMNGPTTFAFEEMEVKQHVLKNATKKYLLADTSKFHKTGTYTFANFSDFDCLFTTHLNNYERRQVQDCQNIIIAY